jgi:predicted site-specific integrase-resolvase
VGSVETQPSNAGGESRTDAVDAIYARVSTRKQLDDLQSQIRALATKYPDHVVFSDCASCLNFKRKGLLSLLQLAFEGRLRLVCIAHRDHLCCFAFDLLEYVFLKHGAKIHVEASDLPSSAESELAEDVLAVITVFGARLHGARSAGRRRKPPTQREEESIGGAGRINAV